MTPPPAHVDDTVQAIARLHQAHRARATPAERLVGRATGAIARPGVMAAGLGLVAAWVACNLAAPRLGWPVIDKPPFDLLQGVLTLLALVATALVLSTQRRDDDIATQREQLSLQLAMLSDQKLAKVIALLEELRRDHPELRDRVDKLADEMAKPADPQTVLDALRDEWRAFGRPGDGVGPVGLTLLPPAVQNGFVSATSTTIYTLKL